MGQDGNNFHGAGDATIAAGETVAAPIMRHADAGQSEFNQSSLAAASS